MSSGDDISAPTVAIACGGTGGHLFPGLAVAHALAQRGCGIHLLISPKEIDQQAVQAVHEWRVSVLPAVGFTGGKRLSAVLGFLRSVRQCQRLFRQDPPQAVLAMGGFTSVPPVLVGKRLGAATFLHESNAVPGRANRWLARWVDQAFVGFTVAASRLRAKSVIGTGTPVRPEFTPKDPAGCRRALGLAQDQPVLLITGGSQGAAALNALVIQALPLLRARLPQLQYVHLTGSHGLDEVRAAYARHQARARVEPFLHEMDKVLGAATTAISRAGASSIAELAVMQVPAILIPYPFAVDRHQHHNAQVLADTGAAVLLDQQEAKPEALAKLIVDLCTNQTRRQAMQEALTAWATPHAADKIADRMLTVLRARGLWQERKTSTKSVPPKTSTTPSHSRLRQPAYAHDA